MSEPIDLEGWTLGYSIDSMGGYGVRIFVHRPPEAQKLVEAMSADARFDSERFLARATETVYASLEAQAATIDPKVSEQRARTKKQFQEAFEKAGFGQVFLREIPNEYWGGSQRDGSPSADAIASPWYLVPTFLGPIKIGWRRRVIVIDWRETVLGGLNSQDFIPAGDTTRWDTGVHVYNYEEAARCLQAVHQKAKDLLAQEGTP